MKKAKRYKSLPDIAQQIRHHSFVNRIRGVNEWGGAGVIITANKGSSYGNSDIVVYTLHAQALSWLIRQLKDIVCSDYFWKYEFYGNLATAAIRYQYNGMNTEQLSQLSQQ